MLRTTVLSIIGRRLNKMKIALFRALFRGREPRLSTPL